MAKDNMQPKADDRSEQTKPQAKLEQADQQARQNQSQAALPPDAGQHAAPGRKPLFRT